MSIKKMLRKWLEIETPAFLITPEPEPMNERQVEDALALLSIGVGGNMPTIHERHTEVAKRKHQSGPAKVVDPNDPTALLGSLQP